MENFYKLKYQIRKFRQLLTVKIENWKAPTTKITLDKNFFLGFWSESK